MIENNSYVSRQDLEYEKALSKSDTLIEKLKQALDILEKEKGGLLQQVSATTAERDTYKTELDKMGEENLALKTAEDALKSENEKLKSENAVLIESQSELEQTVSTLKSETQDLRDQINKVKKENFLIRKEISEETQPYIETIEKINRNLERINTIQKNQIPDDKTMSFLDACLGEVALDNILNENPSQDTFQAQALREGGVPHSLLRNEEFRKGGMVTTNFTIIPENGKYRVVRNN